MITLITMKMSLRTESNLRNPFKFPKAVDVAKRYTGEQDNRTAITAFKAVLRHSNMSFNNKPFPANESDENAYIKCYDDKSAQGYCPERWKAMQKWIENTVEVSVISKIKSSTIFVRMSSANLWKVYNFFVYHNRRWKTILAQSTNHYFIAVALKTQFLSVQWMLYLGFIRMSAFTDMRQALKTARLTLRKVCRFSRTILAQNGQNLQPQPMNNSLDTI